MEDYDPRLELAPRDVVARAIHDQMLRRGQPHVLLDISHQPAEAVREHFPMIAERCAAAGIDITTQAIPVAPVQHYICGGVKVRPLPEVPHCAFLVPVRCCSAEKCWCFGGACAFCTGATLDLGKPD